MAIKRSTTATATATADDYLPEETSTRRRRSAEPKIDTRDDNGVFDDEDEDEVADRSSFVQRGWDEASREMKTSSGGGKHTEFKFIETSHLVNFLDSEPLVFQQHWVDRAPGRRSYICIKKACPLCKRGNAPTTKYGFVLVDITEDDLMPQIYIATSTAASAIKEANEGRNGPIDSGFWELTKTGEGKQSRTVIRFVKERDLAEDWGLDSASVVTEIEAISEEWAAAVARAKADKTADPGEALLRTSTAEELREAAEYC